MAKAKKGDRVRVDYIGSVRGGAVFFDSHGKEPFEFTLGDGQLLPGFEDAVTGLEAGKSVRVEIPVDEAYGQRRPELVQKIDRSQIPPEYNPSVGDVLQSDMDDGGAIRAMVVEVDDEVLTLDSNHPLAGKDLVFEIELLEILD